jgi:hypothetical protein
LQRNRPPHFPRNDALPAETAFQRIVTKTAGESGIERHAYFSVKPTCKTRGYYGHDQPEAIHPGRKTRFWFRPGKCALILRDMTTKNRAEIVIIFSILGIALTGCTLFEDSPDIPYSALPAAGSRLVFNERTLTNASTQFKLASRTLSGNRIERGRWDVASGAQAELRLTETLTSHGINAPADPRDMTGGFADLIQVRASFGELYQSDTGAGPAIWRRFVTGDRSCVIFNQRWDSGEGTPVIRTLAGYYCAKPGGTYTIQDTQRTLRTINVKPR